MMKILSLAYLAALIQYILSKPLTPNLKEKVTIEKLKHLPDMILHTSDTIVIDFNDFYFIKKSERADHYVQVQGMEGVINYKWLNKTNTDDWMLQISSKELTKKKHLQVNIDIFSKTIGRLEQMAEVFDLTFTPFRMNTNGRELSKEEDFIGYKNDFVFRFFKENAISKPKQLSIDGSHISSPNIKPVVECFDPQVECTMSKKIEAQKIDYPYDSNINPEETIFLNQNFAIVLHKDIESSDLILNVLYLDLESEVPSMKIVADSSIGSYKFLKVLTMENTNNHLIVCQHKSNKQDVLFIGLTLDSEDEEEIDIENINILLKPKDRLEVSDILTIGLKENTVLAFDRPSSKLDDGHFKQNGFLFDVNFKPFSVFYDEKNKMSIPDFLKIHRPKIEGYNPEYKLKNRNVCLEYDCDHY